MAATVLHRCKSLWELLPESLREESHQKVEIAGLCLDSRTITPGDLFVAMPGLRGDGRHFIAQAVEGGCRAVIAEAQAFEESCPEGGTVFERLKRAGVALVLCPQLSACVSEIAAQFYGEPGKAMRVFGVTGTNGKTTCSHLLSQLFSYIDGPCGLVGTLGYGVAVKGQIKLADTGMTTPDALRLQEILAELHSVGSAALAMEVSSHSLHQHRVDAAGIDIGIFTNLSRDHLDYHGDVDSYGRAKAALFSLPGLHAAIVNSDDPFGRWLLSHMPSGIKRYSYGLKSGADVVATHIELSEKGILADVITPWGEGQLSSGLLGRFNLLNLLAVIAAACASGESLQNVLKLVPRLQAVPGRMELVAGFKPLVVVDYAHTPDALEQVLVSLRGQCRGQLWCVFGCGGDRDTGKRPLMGAVAERYADHLVVTSDNPRSEAPMAIIEDIVAGMGASGNPRVEVDRARAIGLAIAEACEEDIIVVAGKGHETFQQLGQERRHFDDVDVARKALQRRNDPGSSGA